MSSIDLRSDTVTRPDAAMYEALRKAPLGDDVLGDDPTVRALEERAAALVRKEAALLVPSGTMGNSIAIGLHARPGDEVLVEGNTHSWLFEAAGGARLWGAQLCPLQGRNGVVPLEALRGAVKPDDVHLPRTRGLILEQTANLAGGVVLPLEYLRSVRLWTEEVGLRFHLDGARIFNASVASGVPVADYAACADTVMFCLSKGLGAPAGSILAGPADLIKEARRLRKVLGGGLRQAGILAACGLHALEHNVAGLAQDHAHARAFAEGIRARGIPGVEVAPPETNMVYLSLPGGGAPEHQALAGALRERGVLALAVLGRSVRFVFHRDVSPGAASQALLATVEALHSLRGARVGPPGGAS